MRDSFLETYNSIWVVDLHGHLGKGEVGPEGLKEENIFDIVQGVAIFLGTSTPSSSDDALVFHSELYGSRESKYEFLKSNSITLTSFCEIHPSSTFYLFVPHNVDLAKEWKQFLSLTDLFEKNSAGIITARDALVLAENKDVLAERIEQFSLALGSEDSIYEKFCFSESKRFTLKEAQAELRKLKSFSEPIRRILHRPFDVRYIFFHSSVVWSLSRPIAEQMLDGENLALVATRQVTRPQFEHVFVSRHIIEIKACSHDRNTQIFPLFIRQFDGKLDFSSEAVTNIKLLYMERISQGLKIKKNINTYGIGSSDELTPKGVFLYIYAILHSPTYRQRYFEFLRSDFPRIPFTHSLELFRELSHLGGELVSLHLLESPKLNHFITEYQGEGDNSIPKKPVYKDGAVWINASQRFANVPEAVWSFHIGGYQVCEKWLKDRKGRRLSMEDIAHYQKVVVALNETIRLMQEIDETIDQHGGWPGAFQSSPRSENP